MNDSSALESSTETPRNVGCESNVRDAFETQRAAIEQLVVEDRRRVVALEPLHRFFTRFELMHDIIGAVQPARAIVLGPTVDELGHLLAANPSRTGSVAMFR